MYFIIVVNLLLCLIYKLNFIIGMRIGFGAMRGFRHPLGVLEHIPVDKGRLLRAFYTLLGVEVAA